MKHWVRMAAVAAVLGAAGCAVTPLDRAADSAREAVKERVSVAPAWPPQSPASVEMPETNEPLTLPAALVVAFTRNPDISRQYARLGIAHGDLRDAARIANPTLSLAWLRPEGGGRTETTQGLSASFSDLLLLPARRRLSAAEFRRVELAVGAALVALAHEVETAWYGQVGTLQVAAMRKEVAEATRTEAELAKRYFDAGNISPTCSRQRLHGPRSRRCMRSPRPRRAASASRICWVCRPTDRGAPSTALRSHPMRRSPVTS
jgi:cobalt-zinc-cadmium efflux system outer membrane protein